MLSAAEAFGIEAIAEGIESEEQRALLISMGCAYGQGYLFSRPVPEDMFWTKLR
jgi:EAL domain-containing protein (putative c-di-GMP-specific phosphodiesterase class I)